MDTAASTDIKELNERIHQESAFIDLLRLETAKAIVGQKNMIDRLLLGLLTQGHILLEGDKIMIEIENIDTFENEDFDVVKFNVKKTEQLQRIFDALSELPNENTFPDYNPHMTIGYVKKGLGEKYKKSYSHKVSSNEICYSMANGEKIYFEI